MSNILFKVLAFSVLSFNTVFASNDWFIGGGAGYERMKIESKTKSGLAIEIEAGRKFRIMDNFALSIEGFLNHRAYKYNNVFFSFFDENVENELTQGLMFGLKSKFIFESQDNKFYLGLGLARTRINNKLSYKNLNKTAEVSDDINIPVLRFNFGLEKNVMKNVNIFAESYYDLFLKKTNAKQYEDETLTLTMFSVKLSNFGVLIGARYYF